MRELNSYEFSCVSGGTISCTAGGSASSKGGEVSGSCSSSDLMADVKEFTGMVAKVSPFSLIGIIGIILNN